MKIKVEKIIVSQGSFAQSGIFKELYIQIHDAITSVTWADQNAFIINPTRKGNGVLPIKKNFIAHLEEMGWKSEVSISFVEGLNPGPIDAIFKTEFGLVAAEWETGNISSSHRALNKIALGITQGKLVAGFLILPVRELAKYLTDRIGNFEEISPYFPLYSRIQIDNGVIVVLGVEYDKLSKHVILIPKGKDGNAIKG